MDAVGWPPRGSYCFGLSILGSLLPKKYWNHYASRSFSAQIFQIAPKTSPSHVKDTSWRFAQMRKRTLRLFSDIRSTTGTLPIRHVSSLSFDLLGVYILRLDRRYGCTAPASKFHVFFENLKIQRPTPRKRCQVKPFGAICYDQKGAEPNGLQIRWVLG